MGTVFIILAGILWGMMGIFVRGLSGCDLTSLEICAVRMSLSTIIVAILLLIYKRKLFAIRFKDLWCFFGTGVLSLTMFGYCYFTTIQMTSLSLAAVLLYTSPIFVLILSAILFKEKITSLKIICIVIAVTGCIFVTGILNGGGNITTVGLLFGLMSGFGYALYSIFSRFAINRGYDPLTITFYSFLFSGVTLLLLASPTAIVKKLVAANVTVNMSYAIGIAMVTTILPYILYTYGLTKVENSKAAVYACIEPIMATVVGFVIFKEVLNIFEIIGILLVLAAIVLLNSNKHLTTPN